MTDAYQKRHEAHEAALRALRNSMREDLGAPALEYDAATPHQLVAPRD
jgi:hypothetical protein